VSSVDWQLDLWTVVGEQFSAVPDVEYPWDPVLVRRIREFDRNYIPLFCKRAYKVPGRGIRVYGFHMMGRRLPTPREEIEPLRLLLPFGGKWAGIDLRGTIVEATVWEGQRPRSLQPQRNGFRPVFRADGTVVLVPTYEMRVVEEADKPGPFIPFTEQFVHSARRAWWEVKNLEAKVRKAQAVAEQVAPRQAAVEHLGRELWAEREDIRDHREKQPASVQVSPKLEQIRGAGAPLAGAA
jgi:hypothetical protein